MKKTRNNFEKKIYKQLKSAQRHFYYERNKYLYLISGHYLSDFTVYKKSNPLDFFIVETKGYFRDADRRKLAAVKKNNPTLDIRIVFMVDKKIRKSGKMMYSDWCKKYGFPYAFGNIPLEWLQE